MQRAPLQGRCKECVTQNRRSPLTCNNGAADVAWSWFVVKTKIYLDPY